MNCLKGEDVEWYKWLEKRVCVKGTLFGTLKYFGKTKFSDGLWCGIELDEPVGKNNGIVNNVEYFRCMPKFGIFVPVSKVSKIENNPKILNDSLMPINETVQISTIQLSTSDCQPSNYNKEKENNIETDKIINVMEDSEESLGLLDPDLIESLNCFNLATDDDIVPDFQYGLLKLDKLGLGTAGQNLSTSDEIIIPKYASTPRHPVKKRFTDFSHKIKMGQALESVSDHNDVFEDQTDCEQDVFFDTDKFKRNPNLASTAEIFQIPDASCNANKNILSPVSCSPILQSDNLNKTQIIPISFLINKDIDMPMDLNRTQTFQNECPATISNIDVLNTTFKLPAKTCFTETKDLNLTVSLLASERSEDYKKSSETETPVDIMPCTKMNLNSTFDSGLKCVDVALKKDPTNVNGYTDDFNKPETANIYLSKTFNSNSSSSSVSSEKKDELLLQKTFILDSNFSEEKQSDEQSQFVDILRNEVQLEPFDYKRKFLEETVILEKSLSDINTRNSVCIPTKTRISSNSSLKFSNNFDLNSTFKLKNKVLNNVSITSVNQRKVSSTQVKTNNVDKKTVEFKKPLSVYSSIRKSKATLKKSTSGENSSYLKENVVVNSDKFLAAKVELKSGVSSDDLKLEQEKKNRRFYSIENKSALTSKSIVSSRRFSYSKSTETIRSNTTGNLPLMSKNNESSRILNKLNLSASEAVPTNDLNVHVNSRMPLNKVKNAVPYKKTKNQTIISLTENSAEVKSHKPQFSGLESKNTENSIDIKLEKENGKFYSVESKSILSSKSLVPSRRFSYSQSIEATVQSSITGNLLSKDNGSTKISNKITISTSRSVPTNNLNVHGTSKVALNGVKSTILAKKIINQDSNEIAKNSSLSELKELITENKLPVSLQSARPTLNGCGIPKRNSLAASSKKNLPIHCRYSMLPSVEEKNFCEAKYTSHIEQPIDDYFVPEAEPSTITSSSKASRIASSLPQKSQITTRKMGQKYSDIKEEGDACPKIPRYNLRRKK